MNPRKMKVEIKKKRKIGYTMISFCVFFGKNNVLFYVPEKEQKN